MLISPKASIASPLQNEHFLTSLALAPDDSSPNFPSSLVSMIAYLSSLLTPLLDAIVAICIPLFPLSAFGA